MADYEKILAEMPRVAEAVNRFTNEAIQRDAYSALVSALFGKPLIAGAVADTQAKVQGSPKEDPAAGPLPFKKSRRKQRSPSLVRDLDLRPASAQSLKDFVAPKAPKTKQEQLTLIVYYLTKIRQMDGVGVDHVYTCMKELSWRVPANPENSLQQVASLKGWLDTSTMASIKVTPAGENLIEHDLPRPQKSST